jgi:endonuclease-3
MTKLSNIVRLLRKNYPDSFHGRLTPFQVLISTVLSQRSRDEITYPTAEKLFLRYKTAEQLACAEIKNIKRFIRRIGFYNVKVKRIKQISRILLNKYAGRVPRDINELLKLPGVGRKTANCVLVYAFRKPAIPVDVHVHRISNRIGLTKTKTPAQTETELTRLIPKRHWIDLNELFVQHGQQTCKPIKPLCPKCPITKYCNYYKTIYKNDT